MTERRQRGEGTIYQRSQDGIWVGAVDMGRSDDGKRTRKVVTSKYREVVEEKMIALREQSEQRPRRRQSGRPTYVELLRATRAEFGGHAAWEWRNKVKALESKCSYCSKKLRVFDVQKDHVVPLSRGGTDTIDNVVPSCARCNGAKSDMTVEEFSRRLLLEGGAT